MKYRPKWSICLFGGFLLIGFIGTYLLSVKYFGYGILYGYKDRIQNGNILDYIDAEFCEFSDNSDERNIYKRLGIEVYGGIQKLLGNRVVFDVNESENVIKLQSGAITAVDAYCDISDQAAKTIAFCQKVTSSYGIPFYYIQTPYKNNKFNNEYPSGIEDYMNENSDTFLTCLQESGVNTFDLRETIRSKVDNADYYKLFYLTDHHWKPETGLIAAEAISKEILTKYGAKYNDDLFQLENYEVEHYPEIFLGSAGRRTGSLYAGKDDFDVIMPRFPTSFSYLINGECREGSLREAYINYASIKKDYYNSSPYVAYGFGDNAISVLSNHSIDDGPTVLLFRDSYAGVLTPYLGLVCGKIINVDLRYFKGDVDELIKDNRPDVVLVMYNPRAYQIENKILFDFDRCSY